jgi:hypothetical protein
MSGWIVVQIILNIGFVAAILVCWARLNRPQKDDPRLSRGLQLLQSKIAILEDLSDRTDLQVRQLTSLLEQKGREVQEQVTFAQKQINKVEVSIQKSMDVSKIFQDKIPHKEIIERQNTAKYVQAAKLANQGLTADEIALRIDIPKSELEFIVKVNKNKLMFDEEHLPDWALDSAEIVETQSQVRPRDYSNVFESMNTQAQESDKKIQEEFKKAIEEVNQKEIAKEHSLTNVVADSVSESLSVGIQNAKNKITGFTENVLTPYFVDTLSEEAKTAAQEIDTQESIAALKKAETLTSRPLKEIETPRAIKSFVFKKLSSKLGNDNSK